MLPAGRLGAAHLEAAAGVRDTVREELLREKLGLTLHPSEAGAAEEVEEHSQGVLGEKASCPRADGADTDGWVPRPPEHWEAGT